MAEAAIVGEVEGGEGAAGTRVIYRENSSLSRAADREFEARR